MCLVGKGEGGALGEKLLSYGKRVRVMNALKLFPEILNLLPEILHR